MGACDGGDVPAAGRVASVTEPRYLRRDLRTVAFYRDGDAIVRLYWHGHRLTNGTPSYPTLEAARADIRRWEIPGGARWHNLGRHELDDPELVECWQ